MDIEETLKKEHELLFKAISDYDKEAYLKGRLFLLEIIRDMGLEEEYNKFELNH